MPENATVYAPLHFFPNEAQLAQVAGAGAKVSVDAAASRATVEWPDGPQIRISRMPDDQMGQHLSGFRGFILQQGAGEGLAVRALSTLSVFGVVVEPGFDEAGRAMGFVAGLTGATDGLCFIGGNIVDRSGQNLLATGAPRPDAARVARRALVLLAVSFRALLEQDAGKPDEAEAEKLRGELAEWWRSAPGVDDEAEPAERALLETPIGGADPRAIMNGVWRAEGAQVLLWALGARDLPDHDAQEHPYEVAKAAGVLADGAPFVFQHEALRSDEDLDWMRRRLLAIHWRLREHRVNPGRDAVDFRALAEKSWFGGFDLEGIALADGDLAIGGKPMGEADPDRVQLASSIAMERHHAINWLIGAHPTYGRVVTPT